MKYNWTLSLPQDSFHSVTSSSLLQPLLTCIDNGGVECYFKFESKLPTFCICQQEEQMPDSIRKVDYFKLMVPNQRGEAAKILKALRGAGVNLLAFSGFPRERRAQLEFIPQDTKA